VIGPIADQVAREIRERLGLLATAAPAPLATAAASVPGDSARAEPILAALGGATNVMAVGAASSRLRLTVVDDAAVDEAALKTIGARGVARPKAGAVQIILGPGADAIAARLTALLTPVV